MIRKVYAFKVLSVKENCFYSLSRDYFASDSDVFVMRKTSRTGELISESRNISESAAAMILEMLLTKSNDVEITHFSYSTQK